MAEDPRPDFEPWWPVCIEDGCRGAQTDWERRCLVHTTDLSRLEPGNDLDLRGVVIDSAKLAEIRGRFRDHKAKRYVYGEVQCQFTWFTGRTWFDETDIKGSASFRDAHFGHFARFDSLTCEGELTFVDARFSGKALMPFLSAGRLVLNRTWFASRMDIGPDVDELDCTEVRFEGGATIWTEGEVWVAGAYFGAPSTISRAKMMSLSGADVSNLVLDETDLSRCRFLGAHRLELLRIDGRTQFAKPCVSPLRTTSSKPAATTSTARWSAGGTRRSPRAPNG